MRLCLVGLFCLACGGTETNTRDDTSTAYAAALSVDAAVEESGLYAAIAGSLTGNGVTGEAAATDATAITARFMPAGCATVTTNKNVNTYTFTNCTGPYGLLELNGTATVTFTPMLGGKVKVELAAQDFKISTASVNLAATCVLTTGVTQQSATVTTSSSATNARGESAAHSGSYTAGWDQSCMTLNGTFTTTVGNVAWSTVIANFRQCTGMCPDSGGTVTVSSERGGSITVHYTNGGTAEVTTTTAGGTRGMIVLSCGAA
jgi:hypothetical protein